MNFPVSYYSKDNIEVIKDFYKLIDAHARRVYDLLWKQEGTIYM